MNARHALCVAVATLVATASAGSLRWVEWIHPGPRDQHAAAHETARGRMIVFGGHASAATQTFEWDGVRWLRAALAGPSPRDSHAMTFDSLRQRVVLFGGVSPSGSGFPPYLGDTWEWDAAGWTLASTGGPHARERHALAYDAARQRVVLFGGTYADTEEFLIFDDTWEWDGTTWTAVSTSGPPARFDAKMAYDAARQRVVLFGGQDGNDFLGDTWLWDGTSWTAAPGSGPPCRSYHAMTYDAGRERVVVFGGASPCVNFPFITDQQDTWEWDGSAWTQVASSGPGARRFGVMTYDGVRQRSVLYGGWPAAVSPPGGGPLESDIPLGDVWEWDGQTWTQQVTSVPRGRNGHRMAYDASRDVTVLFGGRVSIFGYETETWEWDGDGWTRRTLGGPIGPNNPQARGFHSLAYDAARERVWMFGGARDNAGAPVDETWWWDGANWNEHIPQTRPDARYAHSMVYDAARDRLVVFGGIDDRGNPVGDTWEFDGNDWSIRSASGPAPRFEHAMAYDAARARTVLFGGTDSGAADVPNFGDTWEWDGSAWTLVAQTGPAARQSAAVAYDAERERVVIRAGLTNAGGQFELLDDTWEWDGSGWTQIAATGPGANYVEVMAYEPTRSQMLLFGGADSVGADAAFLGETWMLRRLTDGDLDGDGDVDLSDLGTLLSDFTCPVPGNAGHCEGDADGDGDTDLSDLGVVLANFGS